MMNNGFEEKKFAFYKSGSYVADIVFNEDTIIHRGKDIKTNEWSSYEELDLKVNTYDESLSDVWKCFNQSDSINWDKGDDVYFGYGKHYRKYLKVEGSIHGINSQAWVWAMQEDGLPVDIVVCNNKVIAFILANRERCNVLVKPGFEEFTPLKLWQDPLISKDIHGVNHRGKHIVKTRDGASLATDVWLPSNIEKEDKIPAILIRTPYGRLAGADAWLRFVKRGYALVIQDVRGREDSDGDWVPYIYDMNDSDDTINWIIAQPWSDGNVGTIGGSYLGYVQWAAAASGNPHLKAVVSLVAAGPPFIDIKRKGGIYPSGALAWAFMMADQRINRSALKRDDWEEVENIRPIKDIPQKVLGRNIHFWDEYMEHPDNDDFWKKTDWTLHGDKANVPSIIISGWYDDNGMGSTAAWEMNEKHNRENQKIIYGPWKHHFNTTREIHGVKFGNDAIRYDLDVLCLRWFDKFLKNIDNGVEKEPSVQYYMVGENKWIDSEKWPPKDAEYKNIYFHSGGNARTSSGDGTLKMTPPDNQHCDNYIFDPKDPAPFLIDVSENEMNVPENYKDVDTREDILVYTSDILKEDVAIAGNIYAEIYASSSARDTDWLVRLEDVDEAGNSVRLADGILRARYRKSFEKPELLEPGKIEKYEIRMAKSANVFKEGHRIRVTVTSGAKNLAFPNHNTGNNPVDDIEMISAVQMVYHDEKYPSHVKLPVIKGSI